MSWENKKVSYFQGYFEAFYGSFYNNLYVELHMALMEHGSNVYQNI